MPRLPALLIVAAACAGPSVTDTADTAASTVTAPYATIERQFEWTNDFDTEAKFHVPPNAVGIVWAFHGNGGGLPSVQQPEWIAVYNHLVQHGIGVVITKSLDRQTGTWGLADQDELAAIFEAMVSQWDAVPRDIPQGVLGFSGGSQMARMFEDLSAREGWDFRVAAIHQGSAQMTAVPTLYLAAENDDVGRTGAFYEKRGLVDVCVAAGHDCRLLEGTEIRLDRRRFQRLADFDAARSQTTFDEMVAFGLIDAAGDRTVSFEPEGVLQKTLDAYEKVSRAGSAASFATGQLRVVWATHRLSSAFAPEEADFFLEHLQ